MTKEKGVKFWNKEYRTKDHLALSEDPSEDLVKFTRWLERETGRKHLNQNASVLDLGCGNGRNLLYLARTFGMRGLGLDISAEAIKQAEKLSVGLPISYETRSITGELPVPDSSQTFVLDMMTSHFLNAEERTMLISEMARVLRLGGWLFWKTFLLDEDIHAERLLRESPAGESGSYIHPESGMLEHVFTEEEAVALLGENFIIHKITKSHRHSRHAGGKRRSMSIYAQRIAG